MLNIYDDLEKRGILKQVTDTGLRAVLHQGSLTLYSGFDPTADSLHVGHMLPRLALRRFQLAGHRAIAIVGGATGMVGDPTDRAQERPLLDAEQLEHNVAGIRSTMERLLDLKGLEGNPAALVLNNHDWMKGFSYLNFLRDVGKHFTVNHMIAKESIRARLEDREHGISYTEFSYMLLQAYDFYHLYKKEHCTLQIGGSDQWGNITAGCELIRRMGAYHGDPNEAVYGMTFPLILKADGTKFGKSEGGAVWLDPEKTSPYQFYQYFLQTSDADVSKLLRYFSFRTLSEIEALEKEHFSAPEKRLAQKALAEELTALVHGKVALSQSESASNALFGKSIKDLSEAELLQGFQGAPSSEVKWSVLQAGYPILEALVEAGICSSKGAARKEIAGGGIYLNNERVTSAEVKLTEADLIAKRFIALRRGKKTYHLLRFGKS